MQSCQVPVCAHAPMLIPRCLVIFCAVQPATCANVSPVKKPGQKFACPGFREFDPTKANAEAPTADRCCSKVRIKLQMCGVVTRPLPQQLRSERQLTATTAVEAVFHASGMTVAKPQY
jgi:hypothetical protein